MFTVAVAILLASASDVAVTVTVAGLGTVAGAVYFPLASIEPDEAGEIDQLTPFCDVLSTVAENVVVCGGQFVAPTTFGYRLALAGETDTVIGGLLPPQAISKPSSTSDTHNPATAEYFHTLRPATPTSTTPAIGSVNGSHGERLLARCCTAAPVPVFGPLVVMVICTSVAGEPAAIFVGSACPVLKAQAKVVSAGVKKQADDPNVTSFVKVAVPTGVAVKVYTRDVCPASTVCAFGVLALHVKSAAATVTTTAAEVEDAFVPVYFPTMEFAPTGSEVVVKVPLPPVTVTVVRAEVEPLL